MDPNHDLAPDNVRRALEKILASQPFTRSRRASDLLQYLVTETLAARGDRIKAYTVGLEVFERDETFNPDVDSLVRVQAGRLRKALTRYYETEGQNDPIEIQLTTGSYVPEFVPRKSDTDVKPLSENDDAYAPKLVVLPVTNLGRSGDTNEEFSGLTQQLTHVLARFRSLQVISVPSEAEIQTIVDGSGTIYVLSCTIARERYEVSISAQVKVDRSNRVIWSQIYKQPVDGDSVVSVFEDVSATIASTVGSAYGVIAREEAKHLQPHPERPASSYERTLNFFLYMAKKTPEGNAALREHLEEFVEQEPVNARAWAMLSWIYGDEIRQGYDPKPNSVSRSYAATTKAVELGPTDAFVYRYAAYALLLKDNDDLALVSLKRALKLNPNDIETIASYAWQLAYRGDWDEAESLALKTLVLSPAHPNWYRVVPFIAQFRRGLYDKAAEFIETRPKPAQPLAMIGLLACYVELGKTDAAGSLLKQLQSDYPNYLDNLPATFRTHRLPDEMLRRFQAAVANLA